MQCIACGNQPLYLGNNSRFKIYKCPHCGLGQTFGEQKTTYEKYHRDAVYTQQRAQFENIFGKRLEVIAKFKKPGKALEVGSSVGSLLGLLKKAGWDVLGIEPSKTAARTASQKGIKTLNKTFEQTKLSNSTYDVIIFNHVLEHMEDPLKSLKRAEKLLKKNGIVLIDVPNFGSLSAKLQDSGWQYILPEEHQWHFTPKSLTLLLEKAGLTSLYWEAKSGIWEYQNPLKELVDSLLSFKKRFVTNLLTAVPTLAITNLKLGTGLTMVAEKNE